MPCYDPRDDADNVRAAALKEFRHNSPVAEMLCSVLKQIHPSNIQKLPVNVQVWWNEHQARDTEREGAK